MNLAQVKSTITKIQKSTQWTLDYLKRTAIVDPDSYQLYVRLNDTDQLAPISKASDWPPEIPEGLLP